MFAWSEMPPKQAPKAKRHWVMFVVPITVATLLVAFGYQTLGLVIGFVGISIGIATVSSKDFARYFERFAASLSLLIGSILRGVLLAPFYMVVMGPFAFIGRITRSDRLALKVDKSISTYWSKPPPTSGYDRPY